MIEIFTDGSSLGNPGPGGFAAVAFIDNSDQPFEIRGGPWESMNKSEAEEDDEIMPTSAFMEVIALLAALEIIFHTAISKYPGEKEYRIFSDNMYVVNTVGPGQYPNTKSGWMFKWQKEEGGILQSGKAHAKYWNAIYHLLKKIHKSGVTLSMFWVKAHAGNTRNEYADQQAKQFALQAQKKQKLKKK